MVLLLLVTASVVAQETLPITNKAVQQCQVDDLMGAKATILEAMLSEDEAEHPYTWFVKGYIFKEIYKQVEKKAPNSENRELAVDAILHSIELDNSRTYWDNNKSALEFLAMTYFNDAADQSRSLNQNNLDKPELYFNKYKELTLLIDPSSDFSQKEIELYRSLGGACHRLYNENKDENASYFDKANGYYEQVLERDPNDYKSNYNLAISYYNKGVHRIRQIDHNTEIFELILIQDECIDLFKLSLPYMLKAHELKPERKETLKGLMAIYKSLSNDEKASHYQQVLEKLITDGKIRK